MGKWIENSICLPIRVEICTYGKFTGSDDITRRVVEFISYVLWDNVVILVVTRLAITILRVTTHLNVA